MAVTHTWMQRPVHHLPGRMRLPFAGLLHNPRRAHNLELAIRRWPGVLGVRAEARTGRLLLQYDAAALDLPRLQRLLRALEVAPDPPRPLPPLPAGPHPAIVTMTALVAMTGLLSTWLKRRTQGPSTFSKSTTAFDLGAVITIVAGYPELRSGVRRLSHRRQISGDLLLGVVSMLSLLVRESTVGLTVLVMTSLYQLLYARTLARIKQNVHDLLPDDVANLWQPVLHSVQDPPEDPDAQMAEPAVRYASRLAPWAFGAAAATGLITRDSRRALATLLAASPSAVLLCDPLPYASVAAAAADRGIFVKDFAAVRVAGRVQRVLVQPELAEVEELQRQGIKVAVIGHDPSDAPALAAADLAIVITQPCPEEPLPAHVLLDRNNPGNVAWFLAESQRARNTALGNHIWARGLGIAGLFLAGTGLLAPFGAAMYQNITGLGVLLFSARLLPRRMAYQVEHHRCNYPQLAEVASARNPD